MGGWKRKSSMRCSFVGHSWSVLMIPGTVENALPGLCVCMKCFAWDFADAYSILRVMPLEYGGALTDDALDKWLFGEVKRRADQGNATYQTMLDVLERRQEDGINH